MISVFIRKPLAEVTFKNLILIENHLRIWYAVSALLLESNNGSLNFSSVAFTQFHTEQSNSLRKKRKAFLGLFWV